jgi:hypothetical protein
VSERVREDEVALRHFAYFPGAPISAAVWRLLPGPFDDYRLLVMLCTLAALAAALAFRAPLGWKLAIGALLVCNPVAVRSAWFGQNDPTSLLLLVLAFALVTRQRFGWAAASLAGAVLLKQFALVALPFIALMAAKSGAGRDELRRAGLVFAGVTLAAVLPFLIADPGAFYDDTVRYGAGTGPRRELPVRPDRPAHVGAADGLAAARAAPRGRALGRGGRLRHLDPVADVHRPDLQQLLPALAADGRGYGCSDRGRRARNAYSRARPVT